MMAADDVPTSEGGLRQGGRHWRDTVRADVVNGEQHRRVAPAKRVTAQARKTAVTFS